MNRNQKGQFVKKEEPIDVEIVEESDQLPARIDDRLPAVQAQPTDSDAADYEEDYAILRMLYNKLFRNAISAEAVLPDPPDIEEAAQSWHGDLSEALNDLDDAREGKTDVHWRLAEWKQALAS